MLIYFFSKQSEMYRMTLKMPHQLNIKIFQYNKILVRQSVKVHLHGFPEFLYKTIVDSDTNKISWV